VPVPQGAQSEASPLSPELPALASGLV